MAAYTNLLDIFNKPLNCRHLGCSRGSTCPVSFASLFLPSCLALETTVPATFVFWDSLVDADNNNYIRTIAKANFRPYGIDFPGGGSTGRFYNGRTIIDIIGEEMGLKDYISPYLAPTTVGDVVLRGVNYASGGDGILNDTGAIYGTIIMDAQLDNFASTRDYIISTAYVNDSSMASSKNLLGKAVFFVLMGPNDFIVNYFSPVPSIPKMTISPQMFVDLMVSIFKPCKMNCPFLGYFALYTYL
ncbi:GDSL esterase/lipase At4g16230-like [Papaver somniferum]|uniref:GDSL esterase/lipase At4g16230-like n=1 Tax=Papaver somniferum TaxID=3469 RepID=UPI000E70157E|nr:GDSL esterase/lipase At4g16230-like [Papaver somniferum]